MLNSFNYFFEIFFRFYSLSKQSRKAHPHRSFIAGSLAGVVSTSCTYPLDVARARMAVDSSYKSLTEVFTQSIQRYGIKNLYRGFIPTVCGVIPYAGCSFFTYETLKRIHFGELKRLD